MYGKSIDQTRHQKIVIFQQENECQDKKGHDAFGISATCDCDCDRIVKPKAKSS